MIQQGPKTVGGNYTLHGATHGTYDGTRCMYMEHLGTRLWPIRSSGHWTISPANALYLSLMACCISPSVCLLSLCLMGEYTASIYTMCFLDNGPGHLAKYVTYPTYGARSSACTSHFLGVALTLHVYIYYRLR